MIPDQVIPANVKLAAIIRSCLTRHSIQIYNMQYVFRIHQSTFSKFIFAFGIHQSTFSKVFPNGCGALQKNTKKQYLKVCFGLLDHMFEAFI